MGRRVLSAPPPTPQGQMMSIFRSNVHSADATDAMPTSIRAAMSTATNFFIKPDSP